MLQNPHYVAVLVHPSHWFLFLTEAALEQFTNIDWAAFLRQHNMEHSMSRRGNCHDNAVAHRIRATENLKHQGVYNSRGYSL
ncbi:hypothetical protein C0081_03410 [Cohaesibacter celericrescens]|uniref:Transposase n=1 Tax=Cohaesibacter celericrescens TaxID=2067669 RepID=A0A2N5XVV9_9HYPH|nr:hypothetical protein C0081_03410 [Cohaesibacter celericrescens]